MYAGAVHAFWGIPPAWTLRTFFNHGLLCSKKILDFCLEKVDASERKQIVAAFPPGNMHVPRMEFLGLLIFIQIVIFDASLDRCASRPVVLLPFLLMSSIYYFDEDDAILMINC